MIGGAFSAESHDLTILKAYTNVLFKKIKPEAACCTGHNSLNYWQQSLVITT